MITFKPYKDITLTFDEEKHQFYMNGERVVSITEATGKLDKSRPLIHWAVRLCRDYLYDKIQKGKEITADIVFDASKQHTIRKQEAANMGKLIHKWIENYIKGNKPKMPTDEKVKNGILAFLRWTDQNKVKFLNSEKIVCSKKHKYAGIIDAEAKVNGALAIVDFKSSNGLYNEMRYQVAGQQCALEEMTGKKYGERWIIHFNKNTGEFHDHLIEDYKKDLSAFIGLLAVAKRESELNSKKYNGPK